MTITAAGVDAQPARPARLRKLPGLDGLRALAVVAVVVYHLNPSWLPGGYLGVDIFFVISGYLITSLLLSEYSRSGRVHLPAFWARRARRLLPAVVVLLAAVTVLAACFARDSLSRLQGDLPASLFYVMNWRLVFGHVSYAASFGRPPLLQHLWSLSVEEQFYLLWPPLLLLLRRKMSSEHVAKWALGGAAVSALLMGALFRPGQPSGVYFASYTHAEGLLIGCALAAFIPPWRMAATVSEGARHILERSGIVALCAVLAGLAALSFNSSWTYRGGMLAIDLATAVVVATVAHPASRLGDALGRQPLRWVGLRSYSLYLWHWPIFEMLRPGVDTSAPGWFVVLLRLGLTAVAAELSYRFVEQPWREGRAQFALRVRRASTSRLRFAGALALPPLLVAVLLVTAPAPPEPPILSEGSTPAAKGSLASLLGLGDDLTSGQSGAWPPGSPRAFHVAPPVVTPPPPPLTPPAVLASNEPILAIGDSVLLAASPALTAQFGSRITIDAAVGRQVGAGLDRLATYRSSGALYQYNCVLIDLGTNGTFSPAQFQQLVGLLAGVPHVVFFDVHAARSWTPVSNATILAGAKANPTQMRVVDWNAAAGRPGLLYPDGIHPDPQGATVYSGLLKTTLSQWPIRRG